MAGLEPATYALGGHRSNPLSYRGATMGNVAIGPSRCANTQLDLRLNSGADTLNGREFYGPNPLTFPSLVFKSLPRISIPRVGIVPPHVAYSRVGCDFSNRPTRADEGVPHATLGRFVLALTMFSFITTAACTGESPPAPAATPDIKATVTAMVEAIPTQTPYPTSTASPTYTPAPTYTAVPPYPTYTPASPATPYPTYTPAPTAEPYPTLAPLPTHTPVPTATPYPTPEPLPTYTPQPAPTPRTIIRKDDWKTDGLGGSVALGTGPDRGTWMLILSCASDGTPGVFLGHSIYNIFSSGDAGDETLLFESDGDVRELTWTYSPQDEDRNDLYSAVWPDVVVDLLMESSEVVLTIPTARAPYIITFPVAGLDQHISAPADVCGS